MYNIISTHDLIDRDNLKAYYTQYCDSTNLTDLVPNRNLSLKTEEELKEIYKLYGDECMNFKVENGRLNIIEKISQMPISSSMLDTDPGKPDDIWSLLAMLINTDAHIVTNKTEYQYSEDFLQYNNIYLSNIKTLIFSTKHASCSFHLLVDGLLTTETGEKVPSKRWTSEKIIVDNKLNKTALTLVCSEPTLNLIKKNSKVKIFTKEFSDFFTRIVPSYQPEMDSEELYYCILDLTSIPLVCPDTLLAMDRGFIVESVQRLNHSTMNSKLLTALTNAVATKYPDVVMYENESVYKQKDLYERQENKRNGVMYSVVGSKSLPSANKVLSTIGVDSMFTLLDYSKEQLEELKPKLEKLDIYSYASMNIIISQLTTFIDHHNPSNFYKGLLLLSTENDSIRELMKQRLNYSRSILLETLPETVWNEGMMYTYKTTDGYIRMDINKF